MVFVCLVGFFPFLRWSQDAKTWSRGRILSVQGWEIRERKKRITQTLCFALVLQCWSSALTIAGIQPIFYNPCVCVQSKGPFNPPNPFWDGVRASLHLFSISVIAKRGTKLKTLNQAHEPTYNRKLASIFFSTSPPFRILNLFQEDFIVEEELEWQFGPTLFSPRPVLEEPERCSWFFAAETKGVPPGAEKAFLLEELAGCSSHSRGWVTDGEQRQINER